MNTFYKISFGITPNEVVVVAKSETEAVSFCFVTFGLENAPYNIAKNFSETDMQKFVLSGGQILYADGGDKTPDFNFLDIIK